MTIIFITPAFWNNLHEQILETIMLIINYTQPLFLFFVLWFIFFFICWIIIHLFQFLIWYNTWSNLSFFILYIWLKRFDFKKKKKKKTGILNFCFCSLTHVSIKIYNSTKRRYIAIRISKKNTLPNHLLYKKNFAQTHHRHR